MCLVTASTAMTRPVRTSPIFLGKFKTMFTCMCCQAVGGRALPPMPSASSGCGAAMGCRFLCFTFLTQLYFTMYGIMAITLTPALQVASVASSALAPALATLCRQPLALIAPASSLLLLRSSQQRSLVGASSTL